MKHDLKSVGYHLCTTEIVDAGNIYHTWPIIGRDVQLKTTTEKHELPVRWVSGEVWPASCSMEDSEVRFQKRMERDMALLHIVGLHNIVMHA
jgi:hypothetical protein